MALLFQNRREKVNAYFKHYYTELSSNQRINIQDQAKVSFEDLNKIKPNGSIQTAVKVKNKLEAAEKLLAEKLLAEKEKAEKETDILDKMTDNNSAKPRL